MEGPINYPIDFLFISLIILILLIITTVSLLLYIITIKRKNKQLKDLFGEVEFKGKMLESIYQTVPIGIVVTDNQGRIISYNDEFLKIFKINDIKEKDSNLANIIGVEYFSKFSDAIKNNLLNTDKRVFEFSSVLSDGTFRYYQHIFSIANSEYIASPFLVHIFVDVTDQKLVQIKVKKSEEKYRTFVELSSDAIYCFEAKEPIAIDLPIEKQIQEFFSKGFLSDCNLSFAKYYGFESPESAIGTPLSQIISPNNQSKISLLQNFVENNYKTDGFITNFTAPDGNTYFVRNSLFGVVENGKLVRVWGAFQDITQLIILQKQYQEAAAKYENLIENLNSIILHVDLTGRIIFINSYGLKFFGYSKDEIIGKHVIDTIVPRVESGTGRNLEELVKDIIANPNKYEHNENENIKKDGTRVWISWKNTPIFDSNGRCVEVLSVGIDITERRKKELELKRTWDFIYSMVEALPDAISFKDSQGRWIYANKSMLEVFNLFGKEVIGKTDYELIEYDEFFKDELEACSKSDEIAWETKKPIRSTETVKKKDGGIRIFDLIKVPTFNEDGSRRGIAIIARDVTYQKEVEKAIKESEQKHKEIVNSLPLPALVVSEKKIVFANNFAKSLFLELQENDELDFSLLEKYFNSDDFVKLKEIAEGKVTDVKTTINVSSVNGEKAYAVSFVKVLFDGKISILFVFNDVTEQTLYSSYLEKVQKELIFQKYELERVNKQLNEKNKELAELNATKDRFFSIIAHDLKNPVYGVKNLSDEFLRSFDELKHEEMREFVFAINSSSSKLADLIENLLLWARTQTQTLKYNPVEVNLRYVVENTISFFQDNAKQKNIILLSRIDDNTTIFADVNSVQTILRNLISNAIKFTNEGGVIRIYSQTVEENGTWFERISVQDNGVGIPYEVQDKLLQLDFHFSALGTKNERGTGLGLNITKELVKMNGGRLWFESTPKVGTTFHFTLPRKKGDK